MKKHFCRNCGDELTGRYCSRCGQRNDIGRLSWKALFEGFMSVIFGKDYNRESGDIPRYGLFGTFWRILFHPVTTIKEYIAGKRVRYFSPIGMLFLLSALCVLLSYWTGVKIMDGQPETPGFEPFLEYGNTHPVVFWLLVAPFSALAYKWVFAKISNVKYVEYLYIEIFLSIIGMTITCARILFLSIFPARENTVAYLFSGIDAIVIVGISAALFHSLLKISRSRAIFSSLVGNIVGYVLIFAAIFAATLVCVLVFGL